MTTSTPTPLTAQPAVSTPDLGPLHRAGFYAWFAFLSCLLAASGAALLLYQEEGIVWPLVALGGFAFLALIAALRLIARFRCHETLPASPDALAGVLGFELYCTCRDVAATVFLHPDHLHPGQSTQLLCFVENYASRQRVAHFRIGPHPALGLTAVHTVALHLAAGQAAVYILPLTVQPGLTPGAHDLPVTLSVQKPAGDGIRLPGVYRRLRDLWCVRFAAPFTVPHHGGEQAAASSAPGAPRYLTLAAAGAPAPRFETLESALNGRP